MRRRKAVWAAAVGGVLALAAAVASAAGAAGAGGGRVHGSGPGAIAPAGAAAEIVEGARGYRSWARFSRYAEARRSESHSENYVIAWYNAAAAQAVKLGEGDFPDGSVIVKENRLTPDGGPASLSVMAKRAGAWFWISATSDWKVFTSGGAPLAGDLEHCASCHVAAERDMVFSR